MVAFASLARTFTFTPSTKGFSFGKELEKSNFSHRFLPFSLSLQPNKSPLLGQEVMVDWMVVRKFMIQGHIMPVISIGPSTLPLSPLLIDMQAGLDSREQRGKAWGIMGQEKVEI